MWHGDEVLRFLSLREVVLATEEANEGEAVNCVEVHF